MPIDFRRHSLKPRESNRHPHPHLRPLLPQPTYLADILPRSNSRPVSQAPCHGLVHLHLAQGVLKVYRPWSVALCQVPKVNDGIHRVWFVAGSRQKGAEGEGPTVNRVVVNSWIALLKGTQVQEECGVETVWYAQSYLVSGGCKIDRCSLIVAASPARATVFSGISDPFISFETEIKGT